MIELCKLKYLCQASSIFPIKMFFYRSSIICDKMKDKGSSSTSSPEWGALWGHELQICLSQLFQTTATALPLFTLFIPLKNGSFLQNSKIQFTKKKLSSKFLIFSIYLPRWQLLARIASRWRYRLPIKIWPHIRTVSFVSALTFYWIGSQQTYITALSRNEEEYMNNRLFKQFKQKIWPRSCTRTFPLHFWEIVYAFGERKSESMTTILFFYLFFFF